MITSNKTFATMCLFAMATVPFIFPTSNARADLTLTSGASTSGFTLSTFANGFIPEGGTGGVGPIGIAFPTTGGVLVASRPGNIQLFATDSDGQNAALVPVQQTEGEHNAVGLAVLDGTVYMTEQDSGEVVALTNNGHFDHVVASGLNFATGIVADPTHNQLFVSPIGLSNIVSLSPTGTYSTFENIAADGLSVSNDGSTLYAAVYTRILGFNTTSGAQVFDSGLIGGGLDGTALGSGALVGNLFVNTNDGHVYEINLATDAETLIAYGGSRGDFVTVDPNGSLLITQSSSIERLTAPRGGNFGTPTPEPSATATMSLGALGLLGLLIRARSAKRLPA